MEPEGTFFLGVDTGSTKTHALISDARGEVCGFGRGGPGNHETVGYPGLITALQSSVGAALAAAGIHKEQLAGAGFGVSGYDWPYEEAATLEAIAALGLEAPVAAVNDTILGLLAGSPEGWGLAVVSGTGCNCWGWDRERTRIGHVTGGGVMMGEAAGASELVFKAVQAVAHAWTRRGPQTSLTEAFVAHSGAANSTALLEGLTGGELEIGPEAARLVFAAAAGGDGVARELVCWAGRELGELAKAVIRQLEFEKLAFDVVQVGSLYAGSPLLSETMAATIHSLAPGARLVRLAMPPVAGGVLLAMERAGLQPGPAVRSRLAASISRAHSS